MFRRFSALLFGATLLSSPALAQSSAQGLYLGGGLGQSTFWEVENVEFDLLAFFFSGLVGYRLNPNLRAEGEILYESADVDGSSADIDVIRLLGTAYYDLSTSFGLLGINGIRPYGGIGGGVANVDFGNDDTELTVHGEVGVSAPIAGNLEFVPGVRVSYTSLDGGGDDLWVTQIRAGVRYSF